MKFKGAFYQVLISAALVPELRKVEMVEDGLLVGASVTLTDLAKQLKVLQKNIPGTRCSIIHVAIGTCRGVCKSKR